MTKDEALRLAWDALEDIGDEWGFTSQRTVPKRKEAIIAIKEAFANEALEKMAENARELGLDYEPEPVAWGVFEGNLHDMFFTEAEAVEMAQLKGTHAKVKPLYTPPQRKPLTDEEIQKCYETTGHYQTLRPQDRFAVLALARAIEAAHGIKGEA
jgi:plasmid stabilization system protein ParE